MTGTRTRLMAMLATFVLVGASAASARGSDENGNDEGETRTVLIGYREVPAISTAGGGTFSTRRVSDVEFRFRLTYDNLESPITQSHIHVGQRRVNGGISVFLCSNLDGAPAGTAPCPGTTSGEVTGSVTPAQVIGPVPQGITAREFDELIDAIRAGVAYVNVHTTTFPAGEIRGPLPKRHHG